MKTNTSKLILVATLFVLAGCAVAPQAELPVAVDTIGLPKHVRAQVEQAAAQGRTALNDYLHRTRHTYNLRIVNPDDSVALARKISDSTKMAGAEANKQ